MPTYLIRGTVKYQFAINGKPFSVVRDTETGELIKVMKFELGVVVPKIGMPQERFFPSRNPITDEEMAIVYEKIKDVESRTIDNRPRNERPVWRR